MNNKFKKIGKKIGAGLVLDVMDLIIGNIPVLNTIYDLITWKAMEKVLDIKDNAKLTLFELVLPGIPGTGQIDAFIPMATISAIIDSLGIDAWKYISKLSKRL